MVDTRARGKYNQIKDSRMKPVPRRTRGKLPVAVKSTSGESAAFYRDIVERSMDGIIIVQDNIVCFANLRLAEMYGGPVEEVLGTTLSEHVHPDDRPIAVERYKRRLAGKPVSTTYETRLLRKNGAAVWADVSGGTIIFKGRPADLLFIREVDDRKKAEAALKASEEKYRLHFENVSDVIYSLDTDLRVISVSPSVEKALGYNPDDLIGKRFGDMSFVTPESLRTASVNIPRILAGETIESTIYEFVAKDGRKVIGEVTGTPLVREGKIIGLMAVARDITERRRTEKELEISELRYRTLFENSGTGIVITDRQGVYLLVNKRAAEIMGSSPENLVGKTMFDILPRSMAEKYLEQNRATMDAGVAREYEDTFEFAGVRRVFLITDQCLKDAEGRTIALQSISLDISARKKMEEDLRASEERFARVFKSSPVAIAIARLKDNVFIDVNSAWEKITGFSRDEAVGHTPTELRIWYDQEDRNRLVRALDESGPVYGLEINSRMKSGEIGDVLMSAERTEIDGEPCLLTMATDITEKRKTEEAFKTLALRHEALLAAVPEIVMEVDTGRTYTWANQAGLDFFGADVIGKDASAFFEGEQDTYSNVESLFKGQQETVYVESWQRRRDGRKRLLAWWCRALRDVTGNVTGALSSAQDITDSRLAEKELRTSEAQLSNAMAIAHLGYWEYDVANDEFIFNDHFYDIFHTTADKVGGYRMSSRRYAELFVHPDDAPLVGEETRKALEATDPHFSRQLEHRILFADGTLGYIAVRFFIVKNEQGRTIRTYGANQDITERKLAEGKILASLKEKDVLLRELHHRVKNNMQIISSLLNLQSARLKDPAMIQIFKDTQRRIRSMALVHEKLYQSANLSTIEFDNYLGSLSVHLFHSYENEASGIELVTRLDRILLDIQTAIPCGLLVNELLSNALKHAFPGGRKGKVELELRRLEDGRILLRVKDDGVGLPAGFDVVKSQTLGLQIVTSLVSQLDGSLEVSGQGGAEFRIVFKEAKYAPRP
jgi:PAS domain S-box-containing protein